MQTSAIRCFLSLDTDTTDGCPPRSSLPARFDSTKTISRNDTTRLSKPRLWRLSITRATHKESLIRVDRFRLRSIQVEVLPHLTGSILIRLSGSLRTTATSLGGETFATSCCAMPSSQHRCFGRQDLTFLSMKVSAPEIIVRIKAQRVIGTLVKTHATSTIRAH